MGAIKAKLHEIADLAVEKIDDWVGMDYNEWEHLVDESRYEIIENGLNSFFVSYGKGLAEQEGISLKNYQEFISGHYDHIIKLVMDKIE